MLYLQQFAIYQIRYWSDYNLARPCRALDGSFRYIIIKYWKTLLVLNTIGRFGTTGVYCVHVNIRKGYYWLNLRWVYIFCAGVKCLEAAKKCVSSAANTFPLSWLNKTNLFQTDNGGFIKLLIKEKNIFKWNIKRKSKIFTAFKIFLILSLTNFGVLQGPTLRLLLFNLCINDVVVVIQVFWLIYIKGNLFCLIISQIFHVAL